jgi:hypothetical protein
MQRPITVNTRSVFMASEMLSDGLETQRMDTRIADRAIITVEAISWVAIIIVMGLILSIIGASIYGSLSATH